LTLDHRLISRRSAPRKRRALRSTDNAPR